MTSVRMRLHVLVLAGLSSGSCEASAERQESIRFATELNPLIRATDWYVHGMQSTTELHSAFLCLDAYPTMARLSLPRVGWDHAMYPAVRSLHASLDELARRWRVCPAHKNGIRDEDPIAVRDCAAACREVFPIVLQMLDGVREVGQAAGVEIEPLRSAEPIQKR